MPKRGLSAYMFFANEQREKVREENPGISFGMRFPQLENPLPLTIGIRSSWQGAW